MAEISASVITIVHTFIKVGVLCSVYCADIKTARSEIRSILNEADRFTATLRDVEQLLASPNGNRIESSKSVLCSIGDCRQLLNDLFAKLEQGTKSRTIIWPLNKGEVANLVEKLGRYRDTISLGLHVNQM